MLIALFFLMQAPCSGARLSAAIPKRVNWFVDPHITAAQADFLLKTNLCDGLYTCCGGNGFFENGTAFLDGINTTAIKPFVEAGVPVLATFGGEFLSLATWERRTELADQITKWVLANNLSGIHNDWESHGDRGVDAYKFYEFWEAVATPLHQAGKRIGTCVETAPANISHPWAPRTPSNDTSWHSCTYDIYA
jgi:hypothetical protein